ncbi:MAG: EamA family transporter [Gammaproteobacteria bacterium]
MSIYGLIVLLSCLLYGASAVLSKYALQRDLPPGLGWLTRARLALTNRYWLLGWVLGVVANVLIVQIQALADISLVYPLLNFAYVFTLVLGYLFLNEVLTRTQWLGVLIAVAGSAVLLLVDDPNSGAATDLFHLWTTTAISLVAIAILTVRALRDPQQHYEIYFATGAGIAFGNVETFLKATTNMVVAHQGGFSVLSWDSIAGFLSVWPVWMVALFSLIGFISMQIAYAHGDVSVSVPLITVTQRPVTLFAGYYVFGEAFPPLKVLGVITMLLSVLFIGAATLRRSAEGRDLAAGSSP